ncbi:hypothetical protein GOODEAATRI_030220 [Goodea atripinnis]|uniref:Secreted protein n=1 Tax=Goodea atripinnis TaxID=208336 RepID=A0ABV0NRW0_9TELE
MFKLIALIGQKLSSLIGPPAAVFPLFSPAVGLKIEATVIFSRESCIFNSPLFFLLIFTLSFCHPQPNSMSVNVSAHCKKAGGGIPSWKTLYCINVLRAQVVLFLPHEGCSLSNVLNITDPSEHTVANKCV